MQKHSMRHKCSQTLKHTFQHASSLSSLLKWLKFQDGYLFLTSQRRLMNYIYLRAPAVTEELNTVFSKLVVKNRMFNGTVHCAAALHCEFPRYR